MPVPIAIRDVHVAMPATVVTASLLRTPSTMNTLSNPRCSARTARSTAPFAPTANPQSVSPTFIAGWRPSPGALVLVVLALSAPDAQLRRHRRPRAVEARVRVERSLIRPALQQREPVRVEHTLERLELLAAGLLHRLRAARPESLCQLGALARRRGDAHDKSDRHDVSLDVTPGSPAGLSTGTAGRRRRGTPRRCKRPPPRRGTRWRWPGPVPRPGVRAGPRCGTSPGRP